MSHYVAFCLSSRILSSVLLYAVLPSVVDVRPAGSRRREPAWYRALAWPATPAAAWFC